MLTKEDVSALIQEFFYDFRRETALLRKEAAERDAIFQAEKKERDAIFQAEKKERDAKRDADAAKYEAEKKEQDAKYEAEKKEQDAKYAAERADYLAYQKKTDNRMKIQEDHWGDFIEAFVEHQAIDLFNGIGINVYRTCREKGCKNGENFEFDIVLKNGIEIIFVETKTTLEVKHVKHFIAKLKKIKEWMPEYAGFKIYGAVAYMQEKSSAGVMAAKHGLFTIVATAKSASITNETGFKPAVF